MSAEMFRLPKKRRPTTSLEVTLFVADQLDLMNQMYSREVLQEEILPKVLKNPRIEDAWMDGDRLVARLRQSSSR